MPVRAAPRRLLAVRFAFGFAVRFALPFGVLALAGCAPRAMPTPAAGGFPPGWPFRPDSAVAEAAHGMVATDAPLATDVGVAVLRDGGNAVDAAVATAFALAVVFPVAGNIGGGGFMVARVGGEDAALDFRETAPAAASRDMYLDSTSTPTDRSLNGALAAGVPGSVAGLWEAHRRFGTKPWADMLAPAIRLAEGGFAVDRFFATSLAGSADRLRRFPGTAALLFPDGQPLVEGARWSNPGLASVLRRVADRGPAGFYEGETAGLIVAEMARGGGIVTRADLAAYRAVWREPVVFAYRGRRIMAMPPPSSGGITLALTARMLERYDLGALGWHDPRALHLTVEAFRRAFAVRNAVLGDPDMVDIPRARLLSDTFAARLGASISAVHATPSADVAPGVGTDREGDHTTHFSVVDAAGNAVALTTTINTGYGSGVVVEGAGFLLNNEMDDFSTAPGRPNVYGLVQGEANAIAPGKRMLSSMSPTIVLDTAGRVVLVTGASGGPTIITGVFQVLTNVLDYGMDLPAAVAAPRVHHQHLPDRIAYERRGLTAVQRAALEALGHPLESVERLAVAASIGRRGNRWVGKADPRVAGRAAGF